MDGLKQPGGKSRVPNLVGVLIIVIAIPLLILLGSGQPYRRIQTGSTEFLQIPKKQHTDQEIIVSADKTTLYIPKGATDLTGSFVITPRQPDLFSFASDPDWSRPIVVDIQYRNAEGVPYPGITFSEPVSVCFTLTPEQWNGFTKRPEDFQVQYFDNDQSPSRWISLPLSMDPDRYELCSRTDHLSLYALAVKSVEVIPITGATLTPTATPPPTATVFIFNTQESRRDRNSGDEPAAPNPTAIATQLPPPTKPQPTQPPPTAQPPPTNPPPTVELPTVEPPEPPTVEPPEPPTVEPPEPPPPVPPQATKEPKPTKEPKATKMPVLEPFTAYVLSGFDIDQDSSLIQLRH